MKASFTCNEEGVYVDRLSPCYCFIENPTSQISLAGESHFHSIFHTRKEDGRVPKERLYNDSNSY